MKQKELSIWLKVIIFGTGLCGLAIYAGIIPHLIGYIVQAGAMPSGYIIPWLIAIWISAIPCYVVLVIGWLVAANIGKDNSFSMANAKHLKWVSIIALIDVAYFFTINCVLFLLNMSHPFVMVTALVICFMGTAISVCAAALSHLIVKASKIQEENELTI